MRKTLQLSFALAAAAGLLPATSINFDSQGLIGPSLFGGSAQTLNIPTADGNVRFEGGVILTNTANLPADQTSVYGTANFSNLINPLTITFTNNINNFFLDVFNGETTNRVYRVSDNLGNSRDFTLIPNLSSGQTTIGFAAAGTVVTVRDITGTDTAYDFFVDNIGFNAPLPPSLGTPEPGSLFLLATGIAGVAVAKLRFRSRV